MGFLLTRREMVPRTQRAQCTTCRQVRTFRFDMGKLFGFGSGWRCSVCGSGLPGLRYLLSSERSDDDRGDRGV